MKTFARAIAIAALLAIAPAWAQAPAATRPLPSATLHQKLDAVLQGLAEVKALLVATPTPGPGPTPPGPPQPGPVVVPTPTPVPPGPPQQSGIDYRPFAGMTPFEIQSPFGPLRGQGLPAGWDWNAAFAAGVINPDAAPRPPPQGAPSGAMYASPGDELPFNASGSEGRLVRVVNSMSLKIRPPPGYKGRKQIMVALIPSPYPTQTETITLTVAGQVMRMGFGGGMVTTPELEGGREYDLAITLDPPGGISIQLVGG